MVDRYTKAVLTVIAVALVGLLAVQLTPKAYAQGGVVCGSVMNPCYVRALDPIAVNVKELPIGR